MYKILILTFLLSGLSSILNSQTIETDSLETLLKNSKGLKRVELLSELSWCNLYTDPAKSLHYAILSIKEPGLEKNDSLYAAAYNDLGASYMVLGNYDSSLIALNKSLEIRIKLNDERGIAGIRNKKALIYHWRGQYENALLEQKSVIEYFEKSNDPYNLANAYNNLGELHFELKNFEKAIEIHTLNLDIRLQAGDSIGYAATMHNLGNSYIDMGDTIQGLNYLEKTVPLFKKFNREDMVASVYHNSGTIHYLQGRLNEGAQRLEAAVKILRKLDYKRDLASSLNTLGDIYRVQQMYSLSMSTLKEALNLSKEIDSYVYKAFAYQNLASLFADKNLMDSAYYYSRLNIACKDTLFKQESAEALHDYQVKYETEKKEAENIRLEKENEIQTLKLASEKRKKRNTITAITGIGLFVIIIILFFFIRYRLKKKAEIEKNLAEEQKRRFKAVIEAEEKERIRIAKELHDGLGQLLSTARINVAGLEGEVEPDDEILVKNSLSLIDESVKEVRSISHNMMPAALIEFGLIKAIETLVERINEAGLMHVSFIKNDVPDQFEQSTEIALYRIIQEVLNNMIKHAQAKTITLEIRKLNEKILLKITDDGKGFDVKEIDRSNGIGWKNILSRLSMINGNIDIQSSPGTGTVINIDFTI